MNHNDFFAEVERIATAFERTQKAIKINESDLAPLEELLDQVLLQRKEFSRKIKEFQNDCDSIDQFFQKHVPGGQEVFRCKPVHFPSSDFEGLKTIPGFTEASQVVFMKEGPGCVYTILGDIHDDFYSLMLHLIAINFFENLIGYSSLLSLFYHHKKMPDGLYTFPEYKPYSAAHKRISNKVSEFFGTLPTVTYLQGLQGKDKLFVHATLPMRYRESIEKFSSIRYS